MTTVVLGWDGLDCDLLQRYGLTDRFGPVTKRIDTLSNDDLGKPHTWELWPSMITGKPPRDHGIHAHEFVEGGFSSRWLSLAARLSAWTVPDALRWRVGRLVRDAGATFDFHDLEYYRQRGLATVFDDYESCPIAIPNARSAFDEAVGMQADRGAYLADYLESAGDGGQRRATVPMATLRARVRGDMAAKVAMVEAAHPTHDLVFVWLAYVDTIGHVAPTARDGLMREVYETAATYTERVRNGLGADDSLLCVSDHGLQDGEHTEHACLGGPAGAVDSAEHVLDLPVAIDAVTTASTDTAGESKAENVAEVEQRLDDLGYL
jgi:hypothetical protein